MKHFLRSADILLPDFKKIKGEKWAVIACDQFTSEPEYWEQARTLSEGHPTTLDLILPEVYLEETEKRLPAIGQSMSDYVKNVLLSYPEVMLYLERTQSDGRVRRGIIGLIDLEEYDFSIGSTSLIRATEGTVIERIPPRAAVRRGALVELPHVMLLIDDEKKNVIEPLALAENGEKAYDFDLMLGGGHVCARFLSEGEKNAIEQGLSTLISPEMLAEKYGRADLAPLLFAVGDGNHSLATAKTLYEETRQALGDEAARKHPARYALVEVVNLHDEALDFEPIYRVMFGVDPADVLRALRAYTETLHGSVSEQTLRAVYGQGSEEVIVAHPEHELSVGTLQTFIDAYLKEHAEASVDYIHGEDSVQKLISRPGSIGFLFDGMRKDQLFKTVLYNGVLPRKTFSMGHAVDKRYYIECRKIK